MAVGDAHMFPGFLTPVLTQLFTAFLTCFCGGERRKYAGKKVRLNRGSSSQPPGHESDTLTTEPPGRGVSLSTTEITEITRFKKLIFMVWMPSYGSLFFCLHQKNDKIDYIRLASPLMTLWKRHRKTIPNLKLLFRGENVS